VRPNASCTQEIRVVYSRKAVGDDYTDARMHLFLVDGQRVDCHGMRLFALNNLCVWGPCTQPVISCRTT
jgi:hypothetical protein